MAESTATDAPRGMLLTCIPCDRAYCGQTGTGADAVVAAALGMHGLFGRARRVGMEDLFHWYCGCGKSACVGGPGPDTARVCAPVASDSDRSGASSESRSEASDEQADSKPEGWNRVLIEEDDSDESDARNNKRYLR